MPLSQKVTITSGSGISGVTAGTTALAVAPAPYDSMLFNLPGVGVAASVTFPATPGKRWMIAMLTASMTLSGVAGGGSPVVSVKDGATIIWGSFMALTTGVAGSVLIDHLALTNLALIGSVNTNMVVSFSAGAGGAGFETIAAGAYLI